MISDDKDSNLSLNYISKLLMKSKYQSKIQNIPMSNAIVSKAALSLSEKGDKQEK